MIKLDKELNDVQATILQMGERVIEMHKTIGQLFLTYDKDKAFSILEEDNYINHLEEEVNDLAIGILALYSPVASDLRKIIAAIKIAGDLERIADYAKNIALYMIKENTINDSFMHQYANMQKICIDMLTETLISYKEQNVEAAYEIPKIDKEVDSYFSKIIQEKHLDGKINRYEVYYFAKNIERTGDHIKNICEHIIYLVKGQHFDFG